MRDDGSVVETRDRVSGRNRWIVGALVAQLFMVSAFVAVITADAEPALIVTTCILLLIFSGTYVFLVGRLLQASVAARAAVVGLLLLLTLPAFLVLGTSTTSLWVFVAVAGGMLFPFGAAMAIGVVLAVAMLVIDVIAGDPLSWELALTLVALTAFMAGFAANVRLNIELRETREELAVAAVAAERERIGHDILGHSLTAIAVKAGLARRLLASDPAAAGTEIGDVERLAREALKDVRATASGYREVSLTAELGVAAGVLRAAGIRADLPATADDVDPDAREALGYVLREAVTNVVRHSGARTCRVVLHSRSIEIVDDGDGVDRNPTAGTGAGLQNLADRMGAQGGSCEAGPGPDGGFVIRAGLPAAVPGRTGIGSATA